MPDAGPTNTSGEVTVRARILPNTTHQGRPTNRFVHAKTLRSLKLQLPPGAAPAYCKSCAKNRGSGVYIINAATEDGPRKFPSAAAQHAECQWCQCKLVTSVNDHPSMWYVCNAEGCAALTCISCVQKWGWGRDLTTGGEKATLMLQNVGAGLKKVDDYRHLNRAEVFDALVRCITDLLGCSECRHNKLAVMDAVFVTFYNTDPTGHREHRGLPVGTKSVELQVTVRGGPKFPIKFRVRGGEPVQPNGNPSAGSPQAVRSGYTAPVSCMAPDWGCPSFSGQHYTPSLHHAGGWPSLSAHQHYASPQYHAASSSTFDSSNSFNSFNSFDTAVQAGQPAVVPTLTSPEGGCGPVRVMAGDGKWRHEPYAAADP